MASSRSIAREIGTAFAVLALYLLTILTPLHQARATQLDFAAAGYQTTQLGWVLCSSTTDPAEGKSLVTKCPAAGIAKQTLLAPAPVVLALGAITPALAIAYAPLSPTRAGTSLNPSAPPRGPPAIA
ncbi:hypothetical protein [uncultured Devosia sp.]|uniref:hypothetical protein n=1 Tax=uncultured Devosia sp. TaxID=211434 RepID=UPI0035CBE8E8